ncbi:MAG: transporter ATP-binding protein [Hyphomicrobiales bacterium]|nr:transporter ATP-binding protein [Hyphomicrobiales bacterium]
MSDVLLKVEDIQTYLGDSHIIQGVSFEARAGEVVALLGRNGAGKTTTLRSIMRMAPPRSGAVTFDGRDLRGLRTYEVARAGVAFVQETRAIFPSLSVEENLRIAVRGKSDWSVERVFDDFPHLAARRRNGGAQLSGGEQQMLAIARALVASPRMILLDEPSEGLAPIIVEQIAALLLKLKAAGMTMLLVEQNFALATEIADRAVVLGKGRVRWTGACEDLKGADDVRRTWLGV